MGNDSLKKLVIGSYSMNPLAAILFILAATTIIHNKINDYAKLLILSVNGLIILVASTRLIDFFYPLPFKIDHLFFGNFFGEGFDGMYSMAPTSAVLFILLGGAQLANYKKWWLVKEILLAAVIIGVLFMVAGHVFNVPEFHSKIPLFSTLQACILFLLIAFSIIFSQPNNGLLSWLTSDLNGARVGRLLIPFAVVVPFLIGYLRLLSHRSQISSIELGIAVVVLCYVLIFSTSLFIAVYHLNQRDHLRNQLISEIKTLSQDLNESNTQQLALNEELAASNEELAASNEEINATNEELNVTNEKLKESMETIEQQSRMMLKQKEDALRQSEEYLDIIFSNTNENILLLDANGALLAFNNSLSEFISMATGREPKIGMYVWDMTVPERYNESKAMFESAKNGQTVVQRAIVKRPEGEFYKLVRYEPVFIDNQVKYVSLISIDVTEEERANIKLKQSFEELKKANYELDRFVYSASHDLRAPLASILGLINVAELENTAAELPYLKMIRGRVNHLDGFIKSILDYSRNARTEIEYSEIDLEQLLKESTSSLQLISQYDKLVVITKIETKAPFYSDPLRLSVVFNNILSNAIKFQDSFKSKSTVSVTILVDDQEAHIEITDNGIGIDENHLPKIFDMFYRGTVRSDGSGIGLYIVKETIEKLNGTITVASKLGEYTKFTITLRNKIPSGKTSKDEEVKQVIEQLADASSVTQKKMTYSTPTSSTQSKSDSSDLVKG